jgi:hypothetical protein
MYESRENHSTAKETAKRGETADVGSNDWLDEDAFGI